MPHRDSISSSAKVKDVKIPRKSSEEIMTPGKKLEIKIFSLYRQVWFGIFQVNDRHGPSHMKRLAELFAGAGMSSLINRPDEKVKDHHNSGWRRCKPVDTRFLQPLRAALESGPDGLGSLRLLDGLSVASLEAVIKLLEAYVKEIESLNALYQLLRGLQVGLRMPTEEDETVVLEQFVPTADQFARRILHLEARLDVLVSELKDEFWNKHGPVEGRDGWSVHDVLFPPIPLEKAGKKINLLQHF
ncbi:hypothetical protein N7526_008301 [Penicillium atrosanguineum]|nr:hypothetical protein N7526_008301 [Penicillium atrosanguineum]